MKKTTVFLITFITCMITACASAQTEQGTQPADKITTQVPVYDAYTQEEEKENALSGRTQYYIDATEEQKIESEDEFGWGPRKVNPNQQDNFTFDDVEITIDHCELTSQNDITPDKLNITYTVKNTSGSSQNAELSVQKHVQLIARSAFYDERINREVQDPQQNIGNEIQPGEKVRVTEQYDVSNAVGELCLEIFEQEDERAGWEYLIGEL